MKVPSDIKVISFDLWMTLLAGNHAFTLTRIEVLRKRLSIPRSVEEIIAAYRTTSAAMDHEAEVTGIEHGFSGRIRAIYEALGLPIPELNRFELDDLQMELGLLRSSEDRFLPALLESDITATLAELQQRGYRLGIISNTGLDSGMIMRPVLMRLGILDHFEVSLFSSDTGLSKPNPELFRQLADSFGVAPSSVLHIGDNTNADYRAIEAGFQALVYAPNGSDLPHISRVSDLLSV